MVGVNRSIGIIPIVVMMIMVSIISIGNVVMANDDYGGGIVVIDNKYRDNHPVVLEDMIFSKDITLGVDSKIECKEQSIDVQWTLDTHSAITSTPIIVDLFGQGKKDIVLVNSNNYVDVIDAENGDRAIGWPFILPESTFSSSPILYDIDGDSFKDIIIATREGEIVFIRNDAILLNDYTIKIPPLKVKKYWYLKNKNNGTTNNDNEYDVIFDNILNTYSIHNTDNLINNNNPRQYENIDKEPMEYQFNQNLLQSNQYDNILYSIQYDKYLNENRKYTNKLGGEYVWIDAHILSTPVIADIDKDGKMELLVSVSYYFDHEYYLDPIHKAKLDKDLDRKKYVAGGIICFDLTTLNIKWQTHFDLTNDLKTYSGYLYNSPTVVDINQDNLLEVIVGTSVGYIYVLDVTGKPIKNLIIPMDSIYGQIVAHDLNGDGKVEIIATDSNSNVACFSNTGEEIWENRIVGMTEYPVSIGDINGDGILDVVVGSISGGIYAWSGDTGKPLPHFPIKTKSLILSQLLLVDLSTTKLGTKDLISHDINNGLSIVVHSQDGVLYSIDGKRGCVNKLDIGDSSLTMVLADDINNDGFMELILTTYYGNIYCLSTNSPHHPMKSRTSYNQQKNDFSFMSQGIFIISNDDDIQYASSNTVDQQPQKVKHNKRFRSSLSDSTDILGKEFTITFAIVDRQFKNNGSNANIGYMDMFRGVDKNSLNYYKVSVYFGGEGRVLAKSMPFNRPGIYTIRIPAPPRSLPNLVTLELTNKFGQTFYDSISYSFNLHFARLLKWIIIIPFILSSALLYILNINNQNRASHFDSKVPSSSSSSVNHFN